MVRKLTVTRVKQPSQQHFQDREYLEQLNQFKKLETDYFTILELIQGVFVPTKDRFMRFDLSEESKLIMQDLAKKKLTKLVIKHPVEDPEISQYNRKDNMVILDFLRVGFFHFIFYKFITQEGTATNFHSIYKVYNTIFESLPQDQDHTLTKDFNNYHLPVWQKSGKILKKHHGVEMLECLYNMFGHHNNERAYVQELLKQSWKDLYKE